MITYSVSFLFFLERKHGLNCHRMKPALFSVLCEIKEKTGKCSFMLHTIHCHNTPARMMLFNTDRCYIHNSHQQSCRSTRLLRTIVCLTLTDASLPKCEWAVVCCFLMTYFIKVWLISAVLLSKNAVWLHVNRALYTISGLEMFLMFRAVSLI